MKKFTNNSLFVLLGLVIGSVGASIYWLNHEMDSVLLMMTSQIEKDLFINFSKTVAAFNSGNVQIAQWEINNFNKYLDDEKDILQYREYILYKLISSNLLYRLSTSADASVDIQKSQAQMISNIKEFQTLFHNVTLNTSNINQYVDNAINNLLGVNNNL